MFRHLKAAFLAAPDIPGIGRLPVNAITLAGLAILGFGHPGFWPLALGAEAAYLYALATSPRSPASSPPRHSCGWRSSTKNAPASSNSVSIVSQADDFMIDSDREALKKLSGLFFRVFLSRSPSSRCWKSACSGC